jgi:hypothetical protein
MEYAACHFRMTSLCKKLYTVRGQKYPSRSVRPPLAALEIQAILRLYPELLGMQNNAQTLERLIQCAITTWDTFEEDIMNRVLDTMRHRVDAVLKAIS